MLDIGNPSGIIDKFKSYRSVRIFMPDMPASFCAAKIITEILHKELIRFEVDFHPEKPRFHSDSDLHLFIDLDPGECKNALLICGQKNSSIQGSLFTCTCPSKWLHSCILAYSLAKAMNYITNDILWPIITCFGFYKMFTKNTMPIDDLMSEPRFPDDVCGGCKELHEDIVLEIQKAGVLTDIDGLYHIERPCISFLNFTSLFSALQNDIPFVVDRKIHYKKDKKAECQRIHEYLARKGISKEVSCELYANLGYNTKMAIESYFRRSKCFVKKIGYDVELSSTESFFLVCYNLLKGSRVDAFLCLSGKVVPGIKKSIKIHHELIWIFRDCIANLRRLGKTLLFRINVSGVLKDMAVGVLLHLYEHYFEIYIRRRHNNSYSQMIILQGCLENKLVLATNDSFIFSELSHVKERIGEYIVMDRDELFTIIAKLKTKTRLEPSIGV
ncbi:hypothetical protein EROM_020730 [Encephalitozoon romaleae SJ-2008]|uniref:Uncharacterized protein n=1 Tax=Encephalitozoon romaleae (strain SJ-2008) TaxID=1178016 RepID=I6ZH74_ENCRO|nr:hypothetical protein EROM_020730 [Encephalitozoon romaleae SJ-2008]AFN82548.1 hypothetical protein EROM_020730 [Encephalitozoon romaleae SJ-2008]